MDSYIDNGETQVYGPKLVAAVSRELDGRLGNLDPAVAGYLRHCAGRVDEATKAMAQALAAASAAGTENVVQSEVTASARARATRVLRGAFRHLESAVENETWGGAVAHVFPHGLSGIPKAGRALESALDALHGKLKADPSVPEQKGFLKRVDEARRALADELDAGEARGAEARGGLSEQSEVKLAWLRAYRAAALGIESALALAERPELLSEMVPHHAVPGARAKRAVEETGP